MIEAWIGLAGVVVGSIITITKDVWLSWIERQRDGSYSAIRLIIILEEYADKCVGIVQDDGTAQGRPAGRTKDGEEYLKPQVQLPEPIDFPGDIVWRSLKGPLMQQSLAMTTKARSVNRCISASSEHAAPPKYEEYFAARQEGYAQLGLDALELADDLREHYGISTKTHSDLGSGWNPKSYLREKINCFEKHRNSNRLPDNDLL